MVKIKKKEKFAIFKSVVGTTIKLDILVKGRILKITVFKSIYSEACRRCVLLIILAICNIIILILNIINPKLITAIFIIILLDLYRLCTSVREENLVTIGGLGFQVTTKYILGEKTLFIPQEQVQNIFVNEVIFKSKVIYVLSLLTKETNTQEKLIPLFFDTLPRLACLKIIYKHLKTAQQ